jgi:hypothetical protein
MLGNMSKTRREEGGRKLRINKGVELMLQKRRNQEPPKTFKICFGKMVSLLRREFHIYFEFSFYTRKQNITLRGK